MSGLDEQFSDVCPRCNIIPNYWVLGNKILRGLVWLYTERYPDSNMKDSIEFSRFKEIERVGDIESKIDCVRCSRCFSQIEDMVFIKSKIKRVKRLEEEGRVDLP